MVDNLFCFVNVWLLTLWLGKYIDSIYNWIHEPFEHFH